MTPKAIQYAACGLPAGHANKTWDDCEISQPEKDRLNGAFKTPVDSVVFIQGTSAPIINQLMDQKMKVRGIDLIKRLQNPFEEPNNPEAEVILLYNAERYTGKPEIAISVFKNILNYYKGKGILILVESSESSNFVRDSYGTQIVNKLKIPHTKDVKWL